MTINIADNSPRISYSVADGVTQTSFAVPFEFFDDEDLNVYVDGTLKTLTSDYTVTGGDGSTGTVTISVTGASGGSTVVITRDITLERTTDFPVSGAFNIVALNTELDRLIAVAADLDDRASRALQLTDYDVAVGLTLPDVDTRKGKTLAFNLTTGAVEAGPSTSDVQSVSDTAADIALLADIQDGTIDTNALTNLNSIRTDVTTVSGISSNVTTVATNNANVTTVATDLSGSDTIGTVAGSISNVNTVATNITNVNTTATNIASVNTVAGEIGVSGVVTIVANAITDVSTVSGDIAAVITAANDLNEAVSEIDTVANAITNVDTVGTNIANVNTVAGISSDVTTVANDGTDIGTVATNIANVNTVAGISGNVTTVAGISADVTTVAADGTDIGTVAGISSDVTTVSGISANVTTVAGISANVTTVAGISANVTTVAGDTANIGTIATNLNGTDTIGTVAGSISNVNSVGGSITNVNTVATNLTSINSFANTYRIGTTDPTTSLDTGDLFFNTSSGVLKVYNGTAWEAGVTAGSGFLPLTGGTMTGALDVQSTVTADGLTVDGEATFGTATGVFPDEAIFVRGNNGTSGYINGLGVGNSNAQFRIFADDTNNTAGSIKFDIRNRDRVLIEDNGDISFYEDTGTTAKFFWDASAERLDLDGANVGGGLRLRNSASEAMEFYFNGTTANSDFHINYSGSGAADIGVKHDGTVYMNGNVGIGTSSPARGLHVNNNGESFIRITSSDTGNAGIEFGDQSDGVQGAIFQNSTDNSLRFSGYNNSERMRIDSSGNLLVGTTSYDSNVEGVGIGADAFFYVVRQRNTANTSQVAAFNRKGTDGDILRLDKDGSTVGSIGAFNGDTVIGTGQAAFRFNDGIPSVAPHRMDTNNVADNLVDLGYGSGRWKDLYLSGGAYLGGTGSSNKLEDYETGSWTPSIEYDTNGTLSVTYSQRNGAYTKVGNMVTIWGVIRLNGFSKGTASGSLKFTGLPFSSTSTGYRTDLKVLSYRAPFNGPGGFGAMIDNGASYIACVYSRNDNTWTAEADPDGNSEYFFSGSYFTTA